MCYHSETAIITGLVILIDHSKTDKGAAGGQKLSAKGRSLSLIHI